VPRIAYITSTFPDYKKCGIGIYAGYLTEALAGQGHDVHVVTSSIPEIHPTFGKVTVHKIMPNWNLFDLQKLIQLFYQIRPEIIHINHPTAIAAAKSKVLVNLLPEINRSLWKLPLVTTIHEFPGVSLLGKIKILPMMLSSDVVTVTNQRYKEKMLQFLPNNYARRIQVVDIGAILKPNLPDSNKQEQKQRWDLKPDDKVIGFVGFITPPKGFHNLITAMIPLLQADPKLKLLALSSWNLSKPAYRQKILDQIQAAGVSHQVIFTGFLEDDDLWAAMSAIDLCVFAFDYPVEDRSSGPLRQVLYKGLPTIVYAEDINYSEFGLKHGENIWFTPLKDVDALRRDIQYLLKSPELRNRISQGALTLKSELSFDAISNTFSRIYSELLMKRA
jgi:glycosyltransferase involved in cell wall biosynthesis